MEKPKIRFQITAERLQKLADNRNLEFKVGDQTFLFELSKDITVKLIHADDITSNIIIDKRMMN